MWEVVYRKPSHQTFKMKVENGWLYKQVEQNIENICSVALCFVPDVLPCKQKG